MTATTTGSLGSAGPFAIALGGGTFGASAYDVTVNSLTGSGTLTVSVNSNAITDAAGNALAATGSSSQFYTIDRTLPTAVIYDHGRQQHQHRAYSVFGYVFGDGNGLLGL